jgi:hypothetical protein
MRLTLIALGWILVSCIAPATALAQQAEATSPKMVQLQSQLTHLALRVAKENFGTTLNFSHESIRDVERILGELHKEYIRTKREEGVRGLAAEFGAYIITVIEKNSENGVWKPDHPSIGPGSLPFHWRDSTIFPVAWCLKRIVDGDSDNVWVKYEAFVLKRVQ